MISQGFSSLSGFCHYLRGFCLDLGFGFGFGFGIWLDFDSIWLDSGLDLGPSVASIALVAL